MASEPSDVQRLDSARQAYAAIVPRIMAGEPWPLADAFGTEPEADWGPREVLAHVEEMLPYWLGELERVIDPVNGPGPVPFGRTGDDPMRIGIIGRDRSLPIPVLVGRIDDGLRAWAERLETLDDDERQRLGAHPRLGEMPAIGILERFVLSHAEDHVTQLETILGRTGG